MKKRKLKLNELKVKSFVTNQDQIKGGIFVTRVAECDGKTIIFDSNDVACDLRFTFMEPGTGGCQHTDLFCPTKTLPGL